LEEELNQSRRPVPANPGRDTWRKYKGGPDALVPEVDTGVPVLNLGRLLELQTQLPPKFQPHPKIAKILEARREMARGERPLDWAAAEALAMASLATEGVRIRLSGQDCERGTFSHRHAVLHDYQTGDRFMALQHLSGDQAPVDIINSPLSEIGVLGFEYGFSLDYPSALVMWEAQFGDFVNVAQVIIDQFIVSAEDKWRRLSGLVMLLPHGFEGQGPEHSSARMERFLALCAEDNIQVVQPSTPAQFFHVLRRQVVRPWRKPLVVFTPKSMLRHPRAVSRLEDLSQGRFQRVIPDPVITKGDQVRRVLLCSGKFYYELLARREELKLDDVAIVRLEQMYPFPAEELAAALAGYPDGTNVIWVQEEPENMGAWRFLRVTCSMSLFDRFPLTGLARPESASPATGSAKAHRIEQERLLESAFSEDHGPRSRTETISGMKQQR
jgi:2-oxoglutarate dehydrogenase E1 component